MIEITLFSFYPFENFFQATYKLQSHGKEIGKMETLLDARKVILSNNIKDLYEGMFAIMFLQP